jgi:hypothetical protein
MLAVRFTPPAGGETLLKARVYLTGNLAAFKIRLFDSDQHPYTFIQPQGSYHLDWPYQWLVTPNSTGWVSVDISDAQITCWNDFYVAVEFTAPDTKPNLGLDTTSSGDRNWHIENQRDWSIYSSYAKIHNLPVGNIMVRAVIAPIQSLMTFSFVTIMPSTQKSLTEAQTSGQDISGFAIAILAVAVIVTIGTIWKRRRIR